MSGSGIRSWGFVPAQAQKSVRPQWRPNACPAADGGSVLAFGNGRSYGDSCLNSNGTLIDTRSLNRFIQFDRSRGLLTAQTGVLLRDVLELVVPAGWFLPVAPGTSLATLGGALANDVHGKNHHADGTFGCFVEGFTLLRSDGQVMECSLQENADLFAATIGGLGLTGLVTQLTVRLLKIGSAHMDVRYDTFHGLQEFAALSTMRKSTHRYTVAWLDCASNGPRFARGVFMSANHAEQTQGNSADNASGKKAQGSGINFPLNLPSWVLNRYSIKAFNTVYFERHRWLHGKTVRQHYRPFFFPLDAIGHWNRIYGAGGFHQYQFVLPMQALDVMEKVLQKIVASGMGSFLAVLKEFGSASSPGLLSFPREGFCLALDFANRGALTRQLINELDTMVMGAGGAAYPAKDRLMSASTFRQSFPELERFTPWIDPGFTSDFWNRVNEQH